MRKGKKRKRGGIPILLLFSFVFVAYVLGNWGGIKKRINLNMKLRKIEVRAEDEELRQLALTRLKDMKNLSMFKLDLDDLREKLESLPVVRRAYIRKVLPDTLIVELERRKPFLCVIRRGKVYTVDDTGVVMGKGCWLSRKPWLEETGVNLEEVVNFLRTNLDCFSGVERVKFITPFLLEARFPSGVKVRARVDLFLKQKGKWEKLLMVLEKELGNLEYVDFSVEGLIFVKSKGGV